ncbi:MAG: hypothetical protein U0W40_07610 [Acidimicrobiia bacterium]
MTSPRGPVTLRRAVLVALAALGSVLALVPATAAVAKSTTTTVPGSSSTTVPKGQWDPRAEAIAKEVAKLASSTSNTRCRSPSSPATSSTSRSRSTPTSSRRRTRPTSPTPPRLAAIGLVPHTADLVQQQNDLQSSGVLALYQPSKQRVLVRRTTSTPGEEGHRRARAHPRVAGPALRPAEARQGGRQDPFARRARR